MQAPHRMVTRVLPQASVAEVLDRVLDRGIVIDAWLRVSVAGITLIDVDARVVVASISTYVRHSEAIAQVPPASRPAPDRATAGSGRRARRRPGVQLRCEQGCTFTRAAPRRPARVRCPVNLGRSCPVTEIPLAA